MQEADRIFGRNTLTYEIIDNYLPLNEFTQIRDMILGDNFPWYYSEIVSQNDVESLELDPYYFVHKLYAKYTINSNYYNTLAPLITKIAPKSLIRIKANLYPNIGRAAENEWHIDYSYEHKGAIFYINDNNGYTILEDGTKVESRANRILFFDASKQHKSTHCTDAKSRVNINFNYF